MPNWNSSIQKKINFSVWQPMIYGIPSMGFYFSAIILRQSSITKRLISDLIPYKFAMPITIEDINKPIGKDINIVTTTLFGSLSAFQPSSTGQNSEFSGILFATINFIISPFTILIYAQAFIPNHTSQVALSA